MAIKNLRVSRRRRYHISCSGDDGSRGAFLQETELAGRLFEGQRLLEEVKPEDKSNATNSELRTILPYLSRPLLSSTHRRDLSGTGAKIGCFSKRAFRFFLLSPSFAKRRC